MVSANNTILKITAGKTADGFRATFIAEKNIKSVKWNAKDEKGVIKAEGITENTTVCAIFDAAQWSVESMQYWEESERYLREGTV